MIAQGRRKKRNTVRTESKSYRHATTTIDMLPDNVLLEIFDRYRKNHWSHVLLVWEWGLLVHVCRRWRRIMFASPHRLNLRIRCTYGTPVRKNLDIWPGLPIVIRYGDQPIAPNEEDNIIAALEHPDRVCFLKLSVETGSLLEKIVEKMQEPFLVLTDLHISSKDGSAPVLPAEFVGGSAPCLQNINLSGIPIPSLPTLLLSTSDLVELSLDEIPPTGYISPKAMVVGLAALPRLETLVIGFKLAIPRPDQISPPPVTRVILPALTDFRFRGASEYLEDLVSRIDGPQLHHILIVYLNQFVDFQVEQLSQFFDRSVAPKLTLRRAQVTFTRRMVAFTYHHEDNPSAYWRPALTAIRCQGIDSQVPQMTQVFSYFSATLSGVVHLKLEVQLKRGYQLEGGDDVEWLPLLHKFPSVRTLYVSRTIARHVVPALQDITGEMVADVFPFLDLIHLAGQPVPFVKKLVAPRQLSGRPVTVVRTKREFNERIESYVSE